MLAFVELAITKLIILETVVNKFTHSLHKVILHHIFHIVSISFVIFLFDCAELTERSVDRRLFEAGFLFPYNRDKDGNTLGKCHSIVLIIYCKDASYILIQACEPT